jgi:hypothetical protein
MMLKMTSSPTATVKNTHPVVTILSAWSIIFLAE